MPRVLSHEDIGTGAPKFYEYEGRRPNSHVQTLLIG